MRRRRPSGASPFALPELDSCRAREACRGGIHSVAPKRPACFDVSGNGFWVTTPMSGKTKRDKPWMFRTYAGHSTAKASNELYRQNLSKGQTGLSVAFDLPTQTGYDSDDPLARGEVGKVGVPISHLGDMRALMQGIPLGEMNTSMTINATAAWLLSLYVALADEQGVDRGKLTGTVAERHHQGISLARHLCVPAQAIAQADQGRDRLRLARDSEMEPDQCLLLPFAGGWSDADAGACLCPRHGRSRARRGEELRRSVGGGISRSCSPASPSSSMPACASSPRCARCAPSSICGTRSPRSVMASPIRRSGASATACRSTRWAHRAAAREQRLSHPALHARGDAVEEGPRPRRAASGLERGARPAPPLGPAMVAEAPADRGL